MLCFQSGRHPIPCRDSGIIGFALLQIGLLDRAGSHFKGLIRGDSLAAPVRISKDYLTAKSQLVAKIIVPSPPANTHGSLPLIFALMEQSRNIKTYRCRARGSLTALTSEPHMTERFYRSALSAWVGHVAGMRLFFLLNSIVQLIS